MSLEDDLMRLFSGDRLSSIMDRLGVEDGEVIAHKMVTNAIERAQKKVEAQNFAIRKHTLEYGVASTVGPWSMCLKTGPVLIASPRNMP